MIMTGTHDSNLVILSILIAMFASFSGISLAMRMRASTGWMRRLWLGAAAVALGGGIWSMHFVAMLAYSDAPRPLGISSVQRSPQVAVKVSLPLAVFLNMRKSPRS